jgi:hypothetical protein
LPNLKEGLEVVCSGYKEGKWARLLFVQTGNGIGKGKAVSLQAWSGPEGSRKLRFPD